MSSLREEIRPLAFVVLAALVVRMAYLYLLVGTPYFDAPYLDELYYDQWARELASGAPGDGRAYFRAPLYGWMLGAAYAIFGPGPYIPLLAQHALGALSCGLAYLVARRIDPARPATALLAGAFSAIYAPSLFFEGQLLDISLQAALVPLTLLAAFRALETARPRDFFLFGLVGGVGAIARPALLPFYVALFVLHRWIAPREAFPSLRRAIVLFGWAALGVALPILPVTIRNWRVEGVFVPICTYTGVNLWIGNNATADGFTARTPDRYPFFGRYEDSVELFARRRAAEELGSPDSAQVQRYWSRRALGEIAADPARWLALQAKKTLLFFNAVEIKNNKNVRVYASFHPMLPPLLRVAGFGVVAMFALVGAGLVLSGGRIAASEAPLSEGTEPDPAIVLARRRVMLLLLAVLVAGVLMFFVNARYRHPFGVGSIPLAAFAAVEIFSRAGRAWRRRSPDTNRSAGVAFAGLLACAAFVQPDWARLRDGEDLASDWWSVGNCYKDKGRLDDAAAMYERALSLEPAYADAWNNLGEVRHMQRRPGEAVEAFRRAGESAGSDRLAAVRALNNEGVALEAMGRFAEAADRYRRTLELEPEHLPARVNLGDALLATDDAEGARAAYESALQADRPPPLAHLGLARLALRTGDSQRARDHARAFVAAGGDAARAMLERDPELASLASRP